MNPAPFGFRSPSPLTTSQWSSRVYRILALGLDPNEVLSREALVKPHRTIIDPLQRDEYDFAILQKTIRKTLLNEIKSSIKLSKDNGSPGDTGL